MPLRVPNLQGRVAIISGATRGIGRECALALAKAGCNVVIAAKTVTDQPNLPGTIYSVADECRKLGVKALPYQIDLRDAEKAEDCVAQTVKEFGRVDILINNASALWWQRITDTPLKKYDLITQLNARGSFALTRACLPHMERNGWGHVINMSPPIRLDKLAGRTAYCISKFGMTLVALGVAQEYRGRGIAGNSLWPKTIVESYASINFKMGDACNWRKATILSDAVLQIVGEDPRQFTGNMLIDEDYLRTKGVTDFRPYRCNPDVEPPAMEDVDNENFTRGLAADVSKL
eukprot:TRINITY_DN81417_c0_g1_i1.p1 TRINITY_DN81417_c0_g1~~TRINITY_DN81417_c0_g1_i1.p1  ORF type:complete len:308 (+),score=63.28 TRINITY_DN81417_c0_g1_i1:57-926(+)